MLLTTFAYKKACKTASGRPLEPFAKHAMLIHLWEKSSIGANNQKLQ